MPIAIGGLGGSGTRVFAAALKHAGVAIGPVLNGPLDNLWFTVLFKRAVWSKTVPVAGDIAISVELFKRAMTTGLSGRMTEDESALLQALAADLPPTGAWLCGAEAMHAESLAASVAQPSEQSIPWGWKEPNTHLFLPHLDSGIEGLRYIHVIRNGLDMAFSNNTWQADHWAHHYGLRQQSDEARPIRQLRYWIAANERAIDYGTTHMSDRFMVIDYEHFCARPGLHWPRLQRFIGRPASTEIPPGMIAPSNIGRSASEDLSIFPTDLQRDARTLQGIIESLARVG